MAKIKEETTETTETIVSDNQQSNNQLLMSTVLDLQKQIADLQKWSKESPWVTTAKAKERFSWNLQFRYKTWDWIPVLDYKSVKKDSTKPFRWKNGAWDEVDNHYLEIETAEWTVKKLVLLYDFWIAIKWWEPQEAGAILKDWTVLQTVQVPKHKALLSEIERFLFDTEEYWQIKVSINAVN